MRRKNYADRFRLSVTIGLSVAFSVLAGSVLMLLASGREERSMRRTESGKGNQWTKPRMIIIYLVSAILIVVGTFGGMTVGKWIEQRRQATVDTEYVKALITKSSELTAAKFNYTGMTEYEDSGIAVLSKSNFIMVYKATARAGIDVQKVKVKVDDAKKTVLLTIPRAEIQDVKVDTSSIQYFDEGFALANTNQKEDSNEAINMAEKDAREEIKTSGVLEMADTQSEALIKGILQGAVPSDYEFKVTKSAE